MRQIHLQFVKRIITETLYAGLVEYPEWGILRRAGQHQGVISPETFNKIQSKIKKPERKPRETDSLEFPLRRIVTCDFCGKPMTGSCNRSKNPNKYYAHYTCNNKECVANPKNITASKVENEYIDLLDSIKTEKEILQLAKEVAIRIWDKKNKDIADLQINREKEIDDIEKQIDEYMNIIPTTKSESIRSRYEAKIEGLDERVKDLKKELLNKKDPNFEEVLDLALKFLGTPVETWKKANGKIKNLIHNLIFEENPRYPFQMGFWNT